MENIKDPILQIKDVCISYTSDVMAVKHVSADIEKNTITAIMGPSGCGKSTLLRANVVASVWCSSVRTRSRP